METSVNKRILMLKTQLSLTDIEFCGRASISTGTLYKIKNEDEISQRVLNSISNAFGANKEWLESGRGKMFLEKQMPALSQEVPWKDEAYQQLKAERDRLWTLLQHYMSGKANFHKASNGTGLNKMRSLGALA